MSEPQPRPDAAAPAAEAARAEPAAPPPGSTPPQKPLAALLGGGEPSDNTPTIISKNAPAQARAEGHLAESLRGRFLAHFELLEPIGVGGMAAVIRARDTQLDRIVALKILPPEMASDPEHVRRFHQEARSAAKLDHENIARVFYCGQDQGLLFIAFEFVEGENLRTLLEKRRHLPVTEAIHYVLQIATGLAHAAQRGVVHRDIKPSNIIVSASGRAKLVDMGLARLLGPQPDGGLTQSGVTLGTFDYISPEQALEPREADVRSDIYSLGCTLYHMLTGQPPVPEGTAAKKLHHHQHVPPVDPRQLNPAIPDDVAATLGRMMAKDVRERYQQPEHLVQHLLVLAQKVGAPAASPDGVLFVDAPLPSPPQMRPAFLMAAAIVLLVAFIVFLNPGQAPPGPTRANSTRNLPKGNGETPAVVQDAGNTAKAVAPGVVEKTPESTPAVVQNREPPWYTPESAKDLADYLEKHEIARVALAKDLDLEGSPLVFHGRSLEMKAADPKAPPPALRLTSASRGTAARRAALTVQGDGKVTLTGLRFVVDALGADVYMMAVAHEGTGQIILTGCEFEQQNPPDSSGRGRLSAVTVSGPRGEGDIPRLELTGCYFAPGQEAVTLTGAAKIEANDCAFAPHTTALFHLRGRARQGSQLRLTHCSAFLTEGAAFRLADGPACRLDVDECIFSRPEIDPARTAAAPLILQAGPLARGFDYRGNGNCYHNLKNYWTKLAESAQPITTLKEFNDKEGVEVGDRSVELAESPWEARDPLSLLREEPRKAFRVRTNVPQFLRGEELAQLVGVNVWTTGPLYEAPPPRPDEKKPEAVAGRRVVDPTKPSGNGVYPTLEEAVAGAKSGDEILIRVNGRMRLDPIRIRPGFALTVRADEGYQPLLTLNRSDDSVNLFKLFDGQLVLKGLTILLEASPNGLTHQAVVALTGPGKCTLRDCLVTLAGGEGPQLAVVALPEPGAAVRMETRPGRTLPEVELERCFVRGEGDLMAVRASRPFALEVKNSLVVLRQGSLLAVEGAAAEPPAGQPGEQAVELNQVTAYLGEHLLALKMGRNAKGLLKTDVKALGSLFASAGGKSMIHLEGMAEDERVPNLFAWHGDPDKQPNVYSGFSPMLDQMPREEGTMLMPFSRDQWLTFTQEPPEVRDARFRRVEFEKAPAAETSWTKVAAADLRAKSDTVPLRSGADVTGLSELFDKPRAGSPGGDDD